LVEKAAAFFDQSQTDITPTVLGFTQI